MVSIKLFLLVFNRTHSIKKINNINIISFKKYSKFYLIIYNMKNKIKLINSIKIFHIIYTIK